MNREEFITLLEKRLTGIPQDDIKKTVDYYNEIIFDQTEDGLSEEEVVNNLGSIDDIVKLTLSEVSFPKLMKEKLNLNRKLKTWEIVLISSTAIIWFPILIALLAVVLSLYVSLWSGVIALGASSISSLAMSLLIVFGFIDIVTMNVSSGIFLIGIGILGLGLGILLGILTCRLAKIMVIVCKKIVIKCKFIFVRRGE